MTSASAPTVLAVGALQMVLEPSSPDPAIASHRWVPWACCSAAAAAAARRCAENYAESATGTEGSIAAAVDVAIGKKIFRRRPRTGGRAAARRGGDGAA